MSKIIPIYYKGCLICSKSFPYRKTLLAGSYIIKGVKIGSVKQKFCSNPCKLESLKALNRTLEGRQKISIGKLGDKNPMWKGDKASYSAIHQWIRRKYGNAVKCEKCNTKNSLKYEWANVSKKYKRSRKDFIQLCAKCHDVYDDVKATAWATRRKRGRVLLKRQDCRRLKKTKPLVRTQGLPLVRHIL